MILIDNSPEMRVVEKIRMTSFRESNVLKWDGRGQLILPYFHANFEIDGYDNFSLTMIAPTLRKAPAKFKNYVNWEHEGYTNPNAPSARKTINSYAVLLNGNLSDNNVDFRNTANYMVFNFDRNTVLFKTCPLGDGNCRNNQEVIMQKGIVADLDERIIRGLPEELLADYDLPNIDFETRKEVYAIIEDYLNKEDYENRQRLTHLN